MVFRKSHHILDTSAESALGLDRKFASVLHGDCFRAVSKLGKQVVVVWVSRQPLDSLQQQSFLKHVQALSSAATVEVIDFGFDRDKRAFVSLGVDQTTLLDSDHPKAKQIRRRFIECVAKVELFHNQNISCGNISYGSFVVGLDGEPQFTGFLGGFDCGSAEVPLEIRPYTPPPCKNSKVMAPDSDVYALAVLGLELFGAQFPPSGINPEEMSLYLERIIPEAPRWVSRVLADVVRHPTKKAYRKAGDLLAALSHSERAQDMATERNDHGRDASSAGRQTDDLSVEEIARRIRRRHGGRGDVALRRFMHASGYKVAVTGVLVLVVLGTGVLPVGDWWKQISSSSSLYVVSAVDEGRVDEHSRAALKNQSYENLVELVEKGAHLKESSNTWDVIFQRAENNGYQHTTRFVRGLVTGEVRESESNAVLLAKILNPEISAEERLKHLASYEQSSPDSAARVAGGLALESPELVDRVRTTMIRGVERQFPAQVSKGADVRATNAILLALDLKNELSPEVTSELAMSISPDDLWWVIEAHVAKRSAKIAPVVGILLKRQLVVWPRRAFVELVRRAEVSSPTPFEALINSARNGPSLVDVSAYSSWISPLSANALYSVLVNSGDRQVLESAFSALSAKGESQQTASAVSSLIRTKQGDDALPNYAVSIGTLGLLDGISQKTLEQGLRSLDGTALALPIAQLLLQQDQSAVVTATLDLYGGRIHPSFLLPLLEHQDPKIRMAVVPLLKNLPLASSRAAVQKMFATESDPQVRAVYERELGL